MRTLLLVIILFSIHFGNSQTQEATLHFKDGTSWEGYASIIEKQMRLYPMIKFKFFEDDTPEIWDDTIVVGVTFHGFNLDLKYEYHKEKKIKDFPYYWRL